MQHEPDLLAVLVEALDRRGVVEQGDDDLAVFGGGLRADDDLVPVEDARADHAEHHIEVNLNLDEMDLTAAESKATYEDIKAYVKEQTGLNVTHLNIAQTKRKYGIIERDNYNLPKSEDSKQPQCMPEKEAAITEAFKHFGMI